MLHPLAGQEDGSVEGIAERVAQAGTYAGSQPVAHAFGDPAHQAAVRYTLVEERADHIVDPPSGLLDDEFRNRVARQGVIEHQGRENPIVGRGRPCRPVDDLAGGSVETIEHLAGQGRMRDAPVARPQGPANGAQAELGTAAFVRNGEAIAADGENPLANAPEADAAGPDDDHAPVGTGMRAEIRDGGVARKSDRPERELVVLEALQHTAAIETRHSQAGADRGYRRFGQPRLGDGLGPGLLNSPQTLGQTRRNIGWAGFAQAQDLAIDRNQPCPGVGATSIYSEVIVHRVLNTPQYMWQDIVKPQCMEMKGRNGHDLPQREAAMPTEDKSRRYDDLDLWSTRDAVQVMLEAQLVAAATVQPQAGAIAAAAEAAAIRLAEPTGRLIYVGAGTSGRLAVQDGVELHPTFGWSPQRMAYLIAGGDAALVSSIEGSEDDTTAGETAMRDLAPTRDDVVVGVAASGTTPYTVAAVREAHARGALTIGIANNPEATLLEMVAHPIFLDTGAEVVAGSTRMKAGTAQKIALNLFSTALMVRLGGVYRGRMVGMLVSNAKLQTRAVEMIRDITGVDRTIAANVLERANGDIKLAVLIALGRTLEQAAAALSAADGNLRIAIGKIDAGSTTIQDRGGDLAIKVRKRPGSGPRKRAPRY